MYNFKYYTFVNHILNGIYCENSVSKKIYQIYHPMKNRYFLINRNHVKFYASAINDTAVQLSIYRSSTFVYVCNKNYIDPYEIDHKEGEEALKI